MKTNREYRMMSFETRAKNEEGKDECRVDGYASTFEPYVLFEDEDGTQYFERIDEHAFDETDMSDVIFLYNHTGMVYARQKNGTLDVSVDEHGLKISADLSSTEQSRQMFEQIRSGLIDQMSFAFTVRVDEYDKKTHTRTIKSISKLYDVSAVSIPANPGTDINARNGEATADYFNGVIEAEKAERLEEQRALDLAKAKFKFLSI